MGFSPSERASVAGTFWKLYHEQVNVLCTAAHKWLALAVCATAVLTPAGSAQMVSTISQAATAHILSRDRASLLSLLRLLCSLPEEAKSADIHRSLRDEVDAQLAGACLSVCRLLHTLLCDESAVFSLQSAENFDGISVCLDCLRAWVSVGTSAADIHASFPRLFPAVVACLRLPSAAVLSGAADVICATVDVQRYPRQSADGTVTAILAQGTCPNRCPVDPVALCHVCDDVVRSDPGYGCAKRRCVKQFGRCCSVVCTCRLCHFVIKRRLVVWPWYPSCGLSLLQLLLCEPCCIHSLHPRYPWVFSIPGQHVRRIDVVLRAAP
jgi:hypothetical protein